MLVGRLAVVYLAVVSQALTMVVSDGDILEEPQCLSMYDFNYKLLRKVVDLEKSQADVTRQVERQESTIRTLQQRLTQLSEQIDPLKDAVLVHATSPVTFELSKGDRIVFNETSSNIGSSYSLHTGVFRAPLSGSYLLSAEICTDNNAWIGFGIMKGGTQIAVSLSGDKAWSNCASTFTVTVLGAGDEVWVEMKEGSEGSGKPLWAGSRLYCNSFTAYLLRPAV